MTDRPRPSLAELVLTALVLPWALMLAVVGAIWRSY